MEIDAALRRIHLCSPEPGRLAGFYEATYGMASQASDDGFICRGAGRELGVSGGEANRLKYALYAFATESGWQAFLDRTRSLPRLDVSALGALPAASVGFADPDGNRVVFCPPSACGAQTGEPDAPPPAMLQHFALRTQAIEALLAFYSEQLGFVVSDRVQDSEGRLKACFLRTDRLHHSLALFSAPVTCFDHQSYETASWDTLKTWADRMGALRTPMVWGIGRHGPGNDVFFMVRDPDGNLAEISAEIEECAPGRPMGVWPNEERTLNVWGKAIMRS